MLKDYLLTKGLSNRESEVAELVAQGLPNKEVADKLFVTEKTVKFHLTNIYKKMSVKSRAQLIVWCLPGMSMLEHGPQQSAPQPIQTGQINQGPQNIHQNRGTIPTQNIETETVATSNEPPTLFSGQQNKLNNGGSNNGFNGI